MAMGMMAALGLRVSASGAIRQMGKFTHSATNAGRATEKFERSTKNLTATLGALGGFFGVRQMTEYADTWTLITARINVTATSMEQQRKIQMRLFDISQKTRNTLAATAVLYTRVALNADQLGRSSEDLLKMTEAVNAATLLSGSTGVEAAQSIRQLAQAMSKGKLDGDEFRTVMEAMPLVARALADEMGVTIGELQALAPKGLLTVQNLIDALLAKHGEFMEEVESMPFTIGQSIEILNNAMTMMVGILNSAKGVTAKIGEAMRWTAENIDKVVAAMGALLTVAVVYRATLIGISVAQGLIFAVQRLQGWLTLAQYIGRAAAAARLLQMNLKGLAGLFALLAAAAVGMIAYKKLMEEITEATDAWINAEADLNELMGERVDPVDAAAEKTKQRIADLIREAHQNVVLAALVDQMADRQKIAYDAINQRIEARRDLTGDLLLQMENAIDLEEELALKALAIAEAIEAQQDALDERKQIIERFLKNIQRSFADTFTAIMEDGIHKFSDLFDAIKKMFIRLIAEMAAAKMIESFGTSFAGTLTQAFGVTKQQEALNQVALNAAIAANTHRQAAELGGTASGQATPVHLEGMTIEASKSWTRFLAPALAGFFAGGFAGSQTSDVSLGTSMGAMSGAATGFMVGGPWGALIGGITGAIGGFIGASEKARQESAALREQLATNALVTAQNSMRLQEMADFGGDPNKVVREALATKHIQDQLFRTGRFAQRNMNTMDPDLRSLLMKAADLTGIQLLDENGRLVAGSMNALAKALQFAVRDLTQFGNSLRDQLKLQSSYNRIFGIDETPKQKLIDAQKIMNDFAPELMRLLGLSNLNMDSAAARDTLLEGLREMFTMITEGKLTLDLLGSFGDKNQLIDMILATVSALDDLNKVLLNVTTDFPRAMDLVYYEQLYGSFGTRRTNTNNNSNSNQKNVTKMSPPNYFNFENVTIISEGDETGEELLAKLEAAIRNRRARGGSVAFSNEGGWT